LDTNAGTNLKIVSNAVGAKITRAVYRQAYELEVEGIEFFFVALYSNGILRFVAPSTATGALC
jgi:hypothetical protein